MMNKPKEETEKGLLKIEIVSFSSNEIIINKIYDASTVVYYITEKAYLSLQPMKEQD